MLSSNMMPVMMPRAVPMFDQSPFSLGVYPPAIVFHPSPLFPAMTQPSSRVVLPNPWKAATFGYPSSPPLKPQALMSSPTFPHSSPLSMSKSPRSSCVRTSPSPPCSPDSASSNGGETKTAFTIDAILSSNKRSPSSSSHSSSSRSGYGSDRGSTPSPDSFNFVSPKPTSPSKIWNGSRFHAAEFRHDLDGTKHHPTEFLFDDHRDAKSTSTISVTNLGSQGKHLGSTAFNSGRNAEQSSDKTLKRLRCDESEWNPRAKRVRTIFTQEQLERLEQEFDRQQYMVGSERLYLAAELNLSESQVKVWFQNRRIKWRKQNFEKQQVHLAHVRAVQEGQRDDEHNSEEDDEQVNLLVFSPKTSDDERMRVWSSDSETHDTATTSNMITAIVNDTGDEFKHRDADRTPSSSSTCSSASSTSTTDFSTALQLEVKKVEERLAMRLCRRNMQSSSPSSSSTLSSSSHLRLMSSIRRMESSRDLEYTNATKRD